MNKELVLEYHKEVLEILYDREMYSNSDITSGQAPLVCKHLGTGSSGSTAQVPWKR